MEILNTLQGFVEFITRDIEVNLVGKATPKRLSKYCYLPKYNASFFTSSSKYRIYMYVICQNSKKDHCRMG